MPSKTKRDRQAQSWALANIQLLQWLPTEAVKTGALKKTTAEWAQDNIQLPEWFSTPTEQSKHAPFVEKLLPNPANNIQFLEPSPSNAFKDFVEW